MNLLIKGSPSLYDSSTDHLRFRVRFGNTSAKVLTRDKPTLQIIIRSRWHGTSSVPFRTLDFGTAFLCCLRPLLTTVWPLLRLSRPLLWQDDFKTTLRWNGLLKMTSRPVWDLFMVLLRLFLRLCVTLTLYDFDVVCMITLSGYFHCLNILHLVIHCHTLSDHSLSNYTLSMLYEYLFSTFSTFSIYINLFMYLLFSSF